MKPVAQHADEPQKGNTGEWHQIQRQSDLVRTSLKPRPRLQGIGADRKPEQYKAGNQEKRKEDACDGGGARRLQARADQGCFMLHLTLATAFWLIDRCNLAVPLFSLSC